MDTAIAVKSNGHGNGALAVYGDRDDIGKMRDRLVAMLPGAGKMAKEEVLGLAQVAVAHNLNPFNGEVYAIPGKGLMIGIKGLRKKAHEQVKGNFWIDYREITDAAERKRLRIEDGALAFEARLYDSENIRTYTETIKALMSVGIPWEAVSGMVGTRPYSSGIGVLHNGENTKMEPAQCARKRAESNALKQRFDVPFGVTVATDDEPGDNRPSTSAPAGDVIDGTATVIEAASTTELDAAVIEADRKAAAEKLNATRRTMFDGE